MKPAKQKAVSKSVGATQRAWLLGAIALCANLACSSSDAGPDGASAGRGGATATGGATAQGGAAVAGSSPVAGGGSSAGGSSAAGAGGNGIAGSSVGGSSGSSGQSGSGGSTAAGSGGSSAGGSSVGGGSGGSSTGSFDPCPATGDCKVLPLGDSITFGTPTNNGGYRVELFTKAVGDNVHITFVGSQPNGPTMVAGKPFPRGSEGYPGIKTAALNAKLGTALKDKPQIVLLHIGTNNVSEASAFSELEKIIDAIVTALPDSLLAVASIIPLGTSAAVPTYNKGIPDLVKKKADAGKHVIFVDQYKDFPTGELTDGVHPNDTKGYPRMGDKWYVAIKPYLH